MTILEYFRKHTEHYSELSPRQFYRVLFPKNELDTKNAFNKGKYCAIATEIDTKTKKAKRYTVTDDLSTITKLIKSDNFCVMTPVSYSGKRAIAKNARFIYALVIDLDGIKTKDYKGEPCGVVDFTYQIFESKINPTPTMIVFSGNGLHIYYVFDKPLPYYSYIVDELSNLKSRLTFQWWSWGISTLDNAIQYEPLVQPFRIVGTVTKNGGRAVGFKVGKGERVSIDYLNEMVKFPEFQANFERSKSKISLTQAKTKYPAWYEKRVVEKLPKGKYVCHKGLYAWWLDKIRNERKVGGRYWAIHALATYAVKCNVPFEQLKKDALELIPNFDKATQGTENAFTKDDVLKALQAYKEDFRTYPRHTIEKRTMIEVPKNKRNGRTQAMHLKIARYAEELQHPNWRDGNGRKNKSMIVMEWREKHPNGKKIECERETGVSRPTILKWWT